MTTTDLLDVVESRVGNRGHLSVLTDHGLDMEEAWTRFSQHGHAIAEAYCLEGIDEACRQAVGYGFLLGLEAARRP